MRKLIVAITVVTLVFGGVLGYARVKDTPHNVSGTNGVSVENNEVCRPCHTPHNSNQETGFLWNHDLSTGGWTLHEGADSVTLNASTRLCLSCHDGTVAIDSYGGRAGTNFMDGRDNLTVDLTDDHPIGVTIPNSRRYNQPDAEGKVVDAVETPEGQYAKLENNTVQCVSCHYAHGSRADYGMFLRVDNTGSALCMTCHKN